MHFFLFWLVLDLNKLYEWCFCCCMVVMPLTYPCICNIMYLSPYIGLVLQGWNLHTCKIKNRESGVNYVLVQSLIKCISLNTVFSFFNWLTLNVSTKSCSLLHTVHIKQENNLNYWYKRFTKTHTSYEDTIGRNPWSILQIYTY